jgi:hypothetical protein
VSVRNALSRVASIFVETGDAPRNHYQPGGIFSSPPPPKVAVPSIDFDAIYRQNAVPKAAVTAEEALEMIASVPENLAPQNKKRMAAALVNAIATRQGATAAVAAADASAKIAALETHVNTLLKQAGEFANRTQAEIEALQRQIEQKRQAVEASNTQNTDLAQACRNESERLRAVIGYFGTP